MVFTNSTKSMFTKKGRMKDTFENIQRIYIHIKDISKYNTQWD